MLHCKSSKSMANRQNFNYYARNFTWSTGENKHIDILTKIFIRQYSFIPLTRFLFEVQPKAFNVVQFWRSKNIILLQWIQAKLCFNANGFALFRQVKKFCKFNTRFRNVASIEFENFKLVNHTF